MNKQEAIEKIKNYNSLTGGLVEKSWAIHCIEQINEPQKVIVPKFVADFVDDSREYRFDFDEWFDWNNQPKIVQLWLDSENKRQAELNALALVTLIVNGANAVEIEKKKLYTVEIPDQNSYCRYRYLSRNDNGVCIDASNDAKWKQKRKNHFTESEIKQDFEWAWKWAKEVEE